MEMKLVIKELTLKVIEELKKLGYSYNSICGFRTFFKRFNAFAEVHREQFFSEELGMKFLEEQYRCTVNYYLESYPKGTKHQFKHILTAYEEECKAKEYSIRGMRTRLQRLFFFVDYLALRKTKEVNEITPVIISDYVKTIFPHHEKSIASILTTLRVFLRFLYQNGYTVADLSVSVPKQNRYDYPAVPSTWNPEKVKKMLDAIDRGNPRGKRDYAILLLVAKLGIRAGDIKSLKLSDLDWTSKIISIIQEKTKVKVTYPILNDLGWALIDYLKNGRPICDSPYLFVRLCAPYTSFGENANLHNIITKYTREAGMVISKEKHHGLHSLRHSLASTLLEQGIPLPVISEVLGHVDSRSTAVYLRTGMEGLKACALDPEEVFTHD